MRALTIHQPAASLIAAGYCRVENRNWFSLYLGPVAIHAGLGPRSEPTPERPPLCGIPTEMPFGAVVAVANLVAYIPAEVLANPTPLDRFEWVKTHKYARGPICWIFEDVKRLDTPVLHRGNLRLWTFPDELLAGIKLIPVEERWDWQ